ncbi:hypothetical protein F5X99DRAFT_425891 [Biscogniauxia marginata]|nr:hypothetical protein F5X99DRAFT_425891 [Biscogniauxia marginata]
MAANDADRPHWWECRAKYHEARARGRVLLASLYSNTPDVVLPNMRQLYIVESKEFDHPYRLLERPRRNLRELNIDTNRLSFCEIHSPPHDKYLALSRNDAHSGVLVVCEINRKFDANPRDQRLPMSELLWQSYIQDAVNQGLPPSKLRVVWIDTVMNNETKIVA